MDPADRACGPPERDERCVVREIPGDRAKCLTDTTPQLAGLRGSGRVMAEILPRGAHGAEWRARERYDHAVTHARRLDASAAEVDDESIAHGQARHGGRRP